MKQMIGNSGEIVTLYNNEVKKEVGTQDPEKFFLQQKFLNLNHLNFVPIRVTEWKKSYVMPYYKSSYFDYILSHSREENIKKFRELIEIIAKYSEPKGNKTVKIRDYLDKLETRVPYTFTHINEVITETEITFVHGDLTISNIMMEDDNFVFIDPRGTQESVYYDFGKLMQSFYMEYENLLNDEQQDLSIYEDFIKILHQETDYNTLMFYLAVHLIGAVPFFKKKNRPYTDSFLNTGLDIFRELGILCVKKNIWLKERQ